MLVELFKREGTYKDKEGQEKRYVNFYVKCNDTMIPVEPCFFPKADKGGKDPGYAPRKEVLKTFATALPPLPDKQDGETAAKQEAQPAENFPQ